MSPDIIRRECSLSEGVNHKITNAIQFGASVLGWIAIGGERRESTHQFGIVKNSCNLLSCERTIKGNGVSTARVIIEFNSKTLDRQPLTASQGPVKRLHINRTVRRMLHIPCQFPLENSRVPAETEGCVSVH
jgi:hypothetical protein